MSLYNLFTRSCYIGIEKVMSNECENKKRASFLACLTNLRIFDWTQRIQESFLWNFWFVQNWNRMGRKITSKHQLTFFLRDIDIVQFERNDGSNFELESEAKINPNWKCFVERSNLWQEPNLIQLLFSFNSYWGMVSGRWQNMSVKQLLHSMPNSWWAKDESLLDVIG